MHIYDGPGSRKRTYKPDTNSVVSSYEMSLIETLEDANGNTIGSTSSCNNVNDAYFNNNIYVQLMTMGNYNDHDITTLKYLHLINVDIAPHEQCYENNFGKLILYKNIIYVEYRISDTNFMTLRTLADVEADKNIAKIITYYT